MVPASDCDKCKAFDLRRQVRALHDLIAIAQSSVSSLELDSLLRTVLHGAMNFMEMPIGRLALYDKRNGKMSLRSHAGLDDGSEDNAVWTVVPGSHMDRMLRRNEVYFIEDIEGYGEIEPEFVSHAMTRSMVSVPLVTESSIHGMLCMNDLIPRAFDKNRIAQISILASFAAISIENAKYYEVTQQMAINDSLTGLNNRRYFDRVLPQEYDRAQRDGLPFSLIMIDVDNFKQFNDTYGHHLGDRILASIGRVLRKTLRKIDFAFRYGGEEFVVILPETSLESAWAVAERIRQRVMREGGKLLGNRGESPVTVSMGICSYPKHAVCSISLLAMADQLLYQAKKTGKNRILAAEACVS